MMRGNEVWVLRDYSWEPAIVVSTPRSNSKSVVVQLRDGYRVRILLDKVAMTEDHVCIVWESWRGKNGRGGYRVERELYPMSRVQSFLVNRASNFSYSGKIGRVTESEYGALE